jgi:hypothetical protein
MLLFRCKCILHGRKYNVEIKAEDITRAREDLLRKYDKVEQI